MKESACKSLTVTASQTNLFSLHDVELHDFSIVDRSHGFVRVVLNDGRLVGSVYGMSASQEIWLMSTWCTNTSSFSLSLREMKP